MGQPKAQRFEHVELRVQDLSKALEFYTEIVGLSVIAKERGTVYLGCGLDENYDLALTEGGTGVSHFAIRLDSDDELQFYQRRLEKNGVKIQRVDGQEPGQEKGIRFSLPSGHEMELVLVKDVRYLVPTKPAYPRTKGFAPVDADHINLMVPDVKKTAEFLKDVLDFRFSDIVEPNPGSGKWVMAWTRAKEYHHDIGLTQASQAHETLHHFAFAMTGFEQMKIAADMLAQVGIELEIGPGRHPIGPNLFLYFFSPCGNRIELSSEAAIINPNTPPNFWTSMKETLNAWSTAPAPESFLRGS